MSFEIQETKDKNNSLRTWDIGKLKIKVKVRKEFQKKGETHLNNKEAVMQIASSNRSDTEENWNYIKTSLENAKKVRA